MAAVSWLLLRTLVLVHLSHQRVCGAQDAEACHDDSQASSCDDSNSCTFDWCDVTAGQCRHDVMPCPAYKEERLCATGRAVDHVIVIPDDETCALNRTRLEVAESSFTRLTSVSQAGGLSYRSAVVAIAQSAADGDRRHLTLLSGFTQSTVIFQHHSSRAAASRLADSSRAGAPTVVEELFTLARVLRGDPDVLIRTGTLDAVSTTMNGTLRFRPHADLHVTLLTGMCAERAMTPLTSSAEVAASAWLDEAVENARGYASVVSMSVFVDAADATSRSTFGDPRLDVSYADGRAFSRAATLQKLIGDGAEQASTLQAYMLAAGIDLRVFDYDDAALRATKHTVAALFEPPYTLCASECRRRACDPATGCEVRQRTCLDGEFCSPVAGCTASERRVPPNPDTPLLRHSGSYSGDVVAHSPGEVTSSFAQGDVTEGQQQQQRRPHQSCTSHAEWRDRLDPVAVDVRQWSPRQHFVADLIADGRPVILRNTMAAEWPAVQKWTTQFLRQALNDTLLNVKRTAQSGVTFDPDRKSMMSSLASLNLSTPYTVRNMSRDEFFDRLDDTAGGEYYFTELPDTLQNDLSNARLMFASDEDFKLRRHFLWLSSAGMVTHTHFDQDYNFFVQLAGFKTFTIWMPEEHQLMYTFPRLHPMWHKSQVDPAAPDAELHPLFSRTQAYVACLSPGDLLYLPPYAWHHVVSETRSVSVSTYSHDDVVRRHMNAIYKHDHKFDLLARQRGRMFVLRMFLDIMIHNLYGKGETRRFFNRLLHTRYGGMAKLFPIRRSHPQLCRGAKGQGRMPTAQHIYGYATFDAKIVSKHFMKLPSVVRDILFLDYVEEISAQVVGVEDVYAFFRYCFHDDVEYYITQLGDSENDLWEHVAEEDRNVED